MAQDRRKIPKVLEKRVFQEASSRCPFCSEAEVASLEIHHIDGNPSNNVLENLLLVCASCHSKITAGVITASEVRDMKAHLSEVRPSATRTQSTVSVSIANSRFQGDIAHTINKFVTPRAPRPNYPGGSLGADLLRKGYVDYLIAKYYEHRKADASFGKVRPFSHAELHTTIQRTFGCRTFFIPVARFVEVVEFLQGRIDNTILGKKNRARNVPNYHSYEAHLQKTDA